MFLLFLAVLAVEMQILKYRWRKTVMLCNIWDLKNKRTQKLWCFLLHCAPSAQEQCKQLRSLPKHIRYIPAQLCMRHVNREKSFQPAVLFSVKREHSAPVSEWAFSIRPLPLTVLSVALLPSFPSVWSLFLSHLIPALLCCVSVDVRVLLLLIVLQTRDNLTTAVRWWTFHRHLESFPFNVPKHFQTHTFV